MKHVVVITEHFYPRVGGNVVYVDNLTRTMARQGIRVSLIAPGDRSSARPGKENDTNNRHMVYLPVRDRNKDDRIWEREQRNSFLKLCKAQVPVMVKEKTADVVHIMYGHYVHIVLPTISAPLVWTCHNVPPQEYRMPLSENSPAGRVGNAVLRKLIRQKHKRLIRSAQYDQIIAVSEATKHILVTDVGVNPASICVIPNGVDVNQKLAVPRHRRAGAEPLRLLTVGGMKLHKNVHLIPRLLLELKRCGFKVKWYIVGPEDDREYVRRIRDEIGRYHLEEDVFLEGKIAGVQVWEHYQKADLYVHLSREEGFCLTVLEALACGIPVVGTNVGAIPSLVMKRCGLVVEPTTDSILSGLKWAMLNLEQLAADVASRKNLAAQYSWDIIATKTLHTYESILSGRAGGNV